MSAPRAPERLFVSVDAHGYAFCVFSSRAQAAHLASQEPGGGSVELYIRQDVVDARIVALEARLSMYEECWKCRGAITPAWWCDPEVCTDCPQFDESEDEPTDYMIAVRDAKDPDHG